MSTYIKLASKGTKTNNDYHIAQPEEMLTVNVNYKTWASYGKRNKVLIYLFASIIDFASL